LEVGSYDYGARFYDPQIGRFTTIDSKSEKYYSWSPYNYVGGNPIKRIDRNGENWTLTVTRDKNGDINGIQFVLDVAVMNSSDNKDINMDDFADMVKSDVESSFSYDGTAINEKNHLNGGSKDEAAVRHVSVTTKVNIRTINKLSQLNKNEHLINILNTDDPKVKGRYAAANEIGGKIVNVDQSSVDNMINGNDNNTIVHELGHTLGLLHPDTKSTQMNGMLPWNQNQYWDSNKRNRNSTNAMYSGGNGTHLNDKTSVNFNYEQMETAVDEYENGNLNED
jgi:hypothetical protein